MNDNNIINYDTIHAHIHDTHIITLHTYISNNFVTVFNIYINIINNE